MAGKPSPPRSNPLPPPPPPLVTSTITTTTNTNTTTTTTSTTSATTTTTTTTNNQVPRSAVLAKLDWIHDVENEPVITTGVDSLADLDEAINLEQDPNELCDRLICGMAHKGLLTDTSPKIGIVTPCMEPGHTPVLPELGKPGKGYFIIPGTKLSSGPWEQIKADPGSALKSDKGCGYAECSSNWWDGLPPLSSQTVVAAQ